MLRATYEMHPPGLAPLRGSAEGLTVSQVRAAVAGAIDEAVSTVPPSVRETLYADTIAPFNIAMTTEIRGALDEYGSWTYSGEGLTVTVVQR